MRTFYLFELKDSIIKNYKNNYEELYSMLEYIHYLKSEDIVICYNIYSSIVKQFDKYKYDKYLKDNYLGSDNYICYNFTHVINDYYHDESTKLIINNSFIKVKSNKNIPTFFYNIRNFPNLFVCDFNNNDFFILKDTIYNK